jgi:hypothetical protein
MKHLSICLGFCKEINSSVTAAVIDFVQFGVEDARMYQDTGAE